MSECSSITSSYQAYGDGDGYEQFDKMCGEHCIRTFYLFCEDLRNNAT